LLLQGVAEVLKSALILTGRGLAEHEAVEPIL